MENADRTQAMSWAGTVKLLLAWALVGIPLVWGVLQTLSNALNLFQ